MKNSDKNFRQPKVKKYIIQEYDFQPMQGWRDVDGTVRLTREEAVALLGEFIDGKGYSPYGTGEFRLLEFLERE